MPQISTSVRVSSASQPPTSPSSTGSNPSGSSAMAPVAADPSATTLPPASIAQARRLELPQSTAIQSAVMRRR